MWRRLLWWLRRRQRDRDLQEEIRAHLAIEVGEQTSAGLDAKAAGLAARRAFGNVTRITEDTRDVWRARWLYDLLSDTRHALRRLRRTPGFTLAALLTLAIGIGANTAIFSVVNGVLIQPLRFPEPDRLIGVWHRAPGIPGLPPDVRVSASPSMYYTYGDHSDTFERFGLWQYGASTATGPVDPEQLLTAQATHGTLDALGVPPLLGRWFTEEDDRGSTESVILGHGYWQRAFGGDPSAIGQTLELDSRPREIVGVMPASFRFPGELQPQIILPLRFSRAEVVLGSFGYNGIARLKPGVSMEQASADVERLLSIWLEEWPPAPGISLELFRNAGLTPDLTALKSDVVGSIGNSLWILTGTMGLMLLIAGANIANLLLVRTDGRRQELTIRAALGAGWGRIARELLVESLTLSMLGGLLGLGIAWAGLRALLAYAGADLPRADEIAIDPLVLLFALAVSGVSGMLFGLIPVARYAGPRIAESLRAGGWTISQSRDRQRARNTLVVVQVALALVLLVGSGLMIRTFLSLHAVDPGFDEPQHLQMFRLSVPEADVPNPESVMRMLQAILDRVATLPGVESAALATSAPMEGFNNNDLVWARDRSYAEGEFTPVRRFKFVSPGSFEAFGTPILAGRDYDWADLYDRRPVAIVSEAFAQEMWGDTASALGRFIRPTQTGEWREIVGVVGDVSDDGVDQPVPPTIYWPAYNGGFYGPETAVRRAMTYVIRTDRAATETLLEDLHQAVWSVNGALPLALVRTLGDVYQASLARTSYTLVLLAIAGAMALLLGVVGIYGVVSYAVAQRTREVGIRMALGAPQGGVQGLFVRRALLLVAIGSAIGLAGAAGATRLMSSLLFGVSALDPVTYVGVAVVIGLAALLAAYLPARRASRVDPLIALRAE